MTTLFIEAVAALVLAAQPVAVDGPSVLDLLESLQPQLEDFRCEFEGTDICTDEGVKKELKLKADGLSDSFGGVFVWKAGGDIFFNSYHREEPEGKILHEQLVVRWAKHEAEVYRRAVDEPIGEATIDDPVFVTADRRGSYGSIFSLEQIRVFATSEDFDGTMADEVVDGRALKVLTFTFKNRKTPHKRFWLDLKRGGHAVREELYGTGGVLWGRAEITLASFPLGNTKVWIPISGVFEDHTGDNDGKIAFTPAPTSIYRVYIIHGTLQLNRHPGAETFKIAYKPGTPISDNLRRFQYEFGQQRPTPLPSRSEAAARLHEQIAKAEEQRRQLAAGSPARDRDHWTTWLTPIFAGSTLLFSAILLIVRRRR